MTDGHWFALGAAVAVVGSVITAVIGAVTTWKLESQRRRADFVRRWDSAKRDSFGAVLMAGDAYVQAVFEFIRAPGSIREGITPFQQALFSATATMDLLAESGVREAVRDRNNALFMLLARAIKVVDEHQDPMMRALELTEWSAAELAPKRAIVLDAMRAELSAQESGDVRSTAPHAS